MLLLLFSLFIATAAFAAEPVPVPASKAVAESVADFIDDEMTYPEFAIEDKLEGEVVVRLIIEDDGTFEVDRANSVNDDLKEHVIAVIEKLEADQFNMYAGQSVLIKLKFDLLLT